MDLMGDLVDPLARLVRSVYWIASGDFIASKCQWCRMMFLASEAVVIMVVTYTVTFRGPDPGH